MTDTAVLTINGTDVTGDSEWSMTWEERTDGSPGQFSAVIQDRSNSMLLGVTQRDHVKLALTSGWVLYDGEIVNSKLDLPVGMAWGRWNISGSDWNTIPDLRIVGAPTGTEWVSNDGGITFHNWDPNAQNSTDDAATVAALFAAYVLAPPGGPTFDTSTYVGHYIANSALNIPLDAGWYTAPLGSNIYKLDGVTILTHLSAFGSFGIFSPSAAGPTQRTLVIDHAHIRQLAVMNNSDLTLLPPTTGTPPQTPLLTWSGNTLRGALDELRGLSSIPIHVWIDPAGYVHWQAFQDVVLAGTSGLIAFVDGTLTLGMAESVPSLSGPAPAILTDDHPDGVTSIGCRALSYSFDASYMPQQPYVRGVTDAIYNGGAVIQQGTGWGNGESAVADLTLRQIVVDAQAASVAQRLAVGAAYSHYSARSRIKITATFGGRLDEGPGRDSVVDGWRAGQTVPIIDARLPPILNGLSWVIHRVAGKLVKGRPETRLYTIEAGDAPIGRFYAKYRTQPARITPPRQPAIVHEIYFQNLSPGRGEVQTLVSQLLDPAKRPVRTSGLPVHWTLAVTVAGAPATSNARIIPSTTTTNGDGQSSVTFISDSTQDGLTYLVTASTPAQ